MGARIVAKFSTFPLSEIQQSILIRRGCIQAFKLFFMYCSIARHKMMTLPSAFDTHFNKPQAVGCNTKATRKLNIHHEPQTHIPINEAAKEKAQYYCTPSSTLRLLGLGHPTATLQHN